MSQEVFEVARADDMMLKSRMSVQVANKLRDDKKWADAARAYDELLKSEPKATGLWVQKGNCAKEAGERDVAEHAYLRALALEPENADTHLQLGHLKKTMGQPELAGLSYFKCLQYDPSHADASRELETLRLLGFKVPVHQASIEQAERTMDELRLSEFERVDPSGIVDVSIVGRFGKSNGIAALSTAFVDTLKQFKLQLQCVDTRPEESEHDLEAGSAVEIVTDYQRARPSYVSFYCDVIANSERDNNTAKVPSSFIKIAYAVFDASHIPVYWVERLNDFDAVAVTDPFLIDVMKRSGVMRPVFNLPLALDYSALDLKPNKGETGRVADGIADRHDHEPFVFGCIAGFGERKNLDGLIAAFRDAFGSRDDVVLRLHSTLNFSGFYEKLLKRLAAAEIHNVIVSCSELTLQRYARLLRTFDAYVHVSKGEGYSITPRQTLYLGIPTIVSDNSAHRTLVTSGLVTGIPTKFVEKARFEGLGDIECGYQCVPDHDALVGALSRMLNNHARHRARSREMTAYAKSFGVPELKWQYASLSAPKNVFLGATSEIGRSYLTVSDAGLYDKYLRLQRIRRDRVPIADRQRITVVGHDGGFFSVFNTFVSHLVWNQGRPEVVSIVPDWRIDRIQHYRGLTKFGSFCYGARTDGNLWLKFFYPLAHSDASEADYNRSEYLENAVTYDNFNEFNEPNLTYVNAYKLYKDPGFPQWRKQYNLFLRKHVRFRDRITSEVATFQANHFDAAFVIGCHVRHPSHGIEQPGRSMPTVELYQRLIIEQMSGKTDWKVFLASDQASVVEAFSRVFGSRLICRSDVARVSTDHDKNFQSLSEHDRNREGHQIQHITAADESRWTTDMGDEVIVDALLLAECDAFIHVTSNIATAVSFLNPDIEMIYCE